MAEIKERGAASIFVELRDGVITVKHGTEGATLRQWTANSGDWEQLWARIIELEARA